MAGLCSGWIVVEHDESVDWGCCEDVGDLVLGVGGVLGGEFGKGALSRDARELLWCHGAIDDQDQSRRRLCLFTCSTCFERVRGSGERIG